MTLPSYMLCFCPCWTWSLILFVCSKETWGLFGVPVPTLISLLLAPTFALRQADALLRTRIRPVWKLSMWHQNGSVEQITASKNSTISL